METIDLAALFIVGLALMRGVFIGVVREVFSVAALVGGIFAARFLGVPVGRAIADQFPGGPGEGLSVIGAGFVIGIGAALIIGFSGRALKRTLHAAGLGGADRVAGGILGATEGTLVAGLALWLALSAVGPEHPWLQNSRALDWLREGQRIASGELGDERSDVAAPPRR